MDTLLEVRDVHTFIGQYHILQGVESIGPQGWHHGFAGSQRRRKDHHA